MVMAVMVSIVMVAAARRPDLTQSTPRLAVIPAAPAQPAQLGPVIRHHALNFPRQQHRNAQVGDVGKLKPSLV